MTIFNRIFCLILFSLSIASCTAGPPIYDASYKGDYRKVDTLLKRGASPDSQANEGWTPVMIASAEGHQDIVRLLVYEGANVNARNQLGRTPIMFAARYGYTGIVELLANAGAMLDVSSDGFSPLMAASAEGYSSTVEMLISLGADVNLRGVNGNDAIQFAVSGGHYDVVEILLRNGALPNRKNEKGVLPLIAAIYLKNDQIVRLLLARGADPNMPFTIKNVPLEHIPNSIYPKEIVALQYIGVEITPLMYATQHGNLVVVKELLKAGADVNTKNGLEDTALTYAKRFKQKGIEQTLIAAGAVE